MPPPFITESPLLRALLRTLLFAATLETLLFRLLIIPETDDPESLFSGLHESAARAGGLMFFLAFVLVLASLVSLAHGALRQPRWRGGINTFISVTLLTLCALAITASTGPRGPFFAAAFGLLAMAAHAAMLATFFELRSDPAGRIFAVCLAGAMVCMTMSNLAALPLAWIPAGMAAPAMVAGRWLLLFAGMAVFQAFSPPAFRLLAAHPATHAAAYGVPAMGAFALIFGAVAHPPVLSRLAQGLLSHASGTLVLILTTSAAASALFLSSLTALKNMIDPLTSTRACGLILLIYAGYPHTVAYEHLLALLGVALLTVQTLPVLPAPGRMIFTPQEAAAIRPADPGGH